MTGLVRTSANLPASRAFGTAIALAGAGAKLPGRWALWLKHLAWYRALLISFGVCVALPTVLCLGYFGLIAAPQYQSTVRMAVYAMGGGEQRGLDLFDNSVDERMKKKEGSDLEDEPTIDKAGMQGNLLRRLMDSLTEMRGATGDGKDPFLVVNYIKSRAIVSELNRDSWLANVFRHPDADFVSSLAGDAAREDIWKFFNHRVDADVDQLSRLVTINARAYSPGDAHELANRIVLASEKLVNEIRERRIADTLSRADAELQKSQARYLTALASVRALRDEIGVIDPRDGAKALAKALLELKIVKITLETEYDTKDASMAQDSPVRKALEARIAATDAEIAEIERQLTGDPAQGNAVASYLVDFENRETERMLAQMQYEQAMTSYDRAQSQVRRQGVFLAVYAPPSVAEESRFPRTWHITLAVFFVAAAVWSVLCLITAGMRDQVT